MNLPAGVAYGPNGGSHVCAARFFIFTHSVTGIGTEWWFLSERKNRVGNPVMTDADPATVESRNR
jgi:hypothetical protein